MLNDKKQKKKQKVGLTTLRSFSLLLQRLLKIPKGRERKEESEWRSGEQGEGQREKKKESTKGRELKKKELITTTHEWIESRES